MYENRISAGKLLGEKLKSLKDEKKIIDPVVVALPKGGIPVGVEVAKKLEVPLDLIFVKKITVPDNSDVYLGGVSENGIMYLNKELMQKYNVNEQYLQEIGVEKIQEMARLRDKYDVEPILLEDKDVIIVDDGIITGASLYLAAQSIVRDRPRSVILAAPVAPNDEKILKMLKGVSHHLEILHIADNFMSLTKWYDDFHQLNDKEVKELLSEAKE